MSFQKSTPFPKVIAAAFALTLFSSSAMACPVKSGTIAAGKVSAVKALFPVCSKESLTSELSILKGLGKDIIKGNFVETYQIATSKGYPDLVRGAKQLETAIQKAGFTSRQWQETSWGKIVDWEYPNDPFSYLRVVYVTGRDGSVAVYVMGWK